jgi:hypothetical protein
LNKNDTVRDLAKLNIIHLSKQLDANPDANPDTNRNISLIMLNFRMIVENPIFDKLDGASFMEYLFKEAVILNIDVINWVGYRKYKIARILKNL